MSRPPAFEHAVATARALSAHPIADESRAAAVSRRRRWRAAVHLLGRVDPWTSAASCRRGRAARTAGPRAGPPAEEAVWFPAGAVIERPPQTGGRRRRCRTAATSSRAPGAATISSSTRHLTGYSTAVMPTPMRCQIVPTVAGHRCSSIPAQAATPWIPPCEIGSESTPLHNTLTVDGRSQSEPGRPFHWRSRGPRARRGAADGRGFDYVEATHDGYGAGRAPPT